MSQIKSKVEPGESFFKQARAKSDWPAIRRALKIKFFAASITSCEATFPHDCWRSEALSFAHSKKRADIVGDEIYEVALLCPTAHSQIEILPKVEMKEAVLKIISGRKTPI